jgi:hypothetical protein
VLPYAPVAVCTTDALHDTEEFASTNPTVIDNEVVPPVTVMHFSE